MKAGYRLLCVAGVLFAVILGIGFSSAGRVDRYGFLKSDHPVDQSLSARGEWTYFFEGGDPVEKAAQARGELLPAGFTEDTSKRPWFVFNKGDREVVICSHDQIEVDGTPFNSDIAPARRLPLPAGYVPKPSAVVYVHDSRGTKASIAAFQIKKLLLRW